MKLSEYIKNLESILKENGDLEVIYASDDEGNSYDKIYFTPSVGHYNSEEKEYFQEGESMEEMELTEINAVCVN